jgi:hypothetical protein
MYAKRAFVHWYVGEGMEEGEFQPVKILKKKFLRRITGSLARLPKVREKKRTLVMEY